MGLGHSPSIIVDGLVFYIDPNNTNCYPGFGNTVYNLVNPSIGGTFVGYTSNPIDNTENRSLVYNGSTTYQEFYPIEPTRLTVSVWFKATGAPSINDQYGGTILASSPQYYISYGMLYRWTTNTVLFIQSQNGEIISANAPANKYVNAVYTYDGINTKLYIDGVLASTVPYTTDPQYFGSGNRNLRLGVWGYPGYERYFNGIIGQTLIYNRALSATEILQNYNATKKKYDPDENIVTNGLVLHIDPSKNTSYPGTGNTIYDLSGFGNTGTLTNGPLLSSSNGGVIVLDGTNDYISFNNAYASGFGISANATISIWAKITDENYYQPFVGFYNPTAGNRSDFGIDIASNDTERIWKNDSAGGGSYLFKFSRWDNYVLTSDTSTAKMYVNGELKSTLNSSGGINNNRMFVIGYNWDGMSNASISQTLLYNKTLTQQEILQNYNATKNRFVNVLPPVRNGLVLELDAANRASYPGTGNTWYDLSGNGINGTLTNGPAFSGIGATSSISFDGTNDYIDCGYNSTINSSTQFTIECWYKSSNISIEGILFSTNTYGSTPANGYHMEIYQSKLLFQVFPSTSTVQSSITLSNNVWYHLVTTYSSGTINLYVNAVSGGSGTYTFNSSMGNLLLGRYPQGQFSLNGQMSRIKFYNRALSAYEIKQNFDYYRTRYNI
jgi:hypothetical protein